MIMVMVALAATACQTSGVTDDLDDVQAHDPDKIEVITQPDGFPNILRTCLDGVAIFTTTDGIPHYRVPEWDDWCKKGEN